jgi:hypothetical protein
MHFCWSKEAQAVYAVWDHGKFYKTADIFKVRSAEQGVALDADKRRK